jgi:hypothetical protein
MTDLARLVKELSDLKVLEAAELAKRLEERLQRPTAEKITARNFNEGLACEAIVQYLEGRGNGVRSDVEWPEAEQHSLPIEVAFKIGDQRYALEHTGIEPFEGHVEMEAQAAQLYDPIKAALNGALDTTALFELYMPVNAFRKRGTSEIASIQQALADWVKATAPTIPKRPHPDYQGNGTGPVDIPGVPFQVALIRYEPVIVPGHYFELRHTVSDGDQLRSERMKRAIEKKFPKLDRWKRAYGARTILVLEQNDIQLTNPDIVTNAFVPLALARNDRPDETYLVVSCMRPLWLGYPILIGDETFHDLARKHDDPVYWEIDQNAIKPLTNR